MKLHKLAFVLPIVSSLALAACGGGGGSSPSSGLLPSTSLTTMSTSAQSSAYASAVMADAPTAYYHLDDTASTALDSSGNGLSGAIGSSVSTSAAGLVGSMSDTAAAAPGLKSASGVVQVSQKASLQPSSAVSVEAFLRFSSTPADYTVPVEYGQRSGNAPYGWYFKGGHLVAQFTLSTGLIDMVTPSALAANTTYHVVSTFDGSTGRLYVNGALVASASRTGTLANYVSGYGLTMGDSGSFADPAFKGTLDEVAVYAGKALGATRIAAHYAAATTLATASPAPTSSPVLVASTTQSSYDSTILGDAPTAYYHLDDTGSTAADASGNGLNGAIGSSVIKSVAGLLLSSSDSAAGVPGVQSSSGVVKTAQNSKLQPSSAVSMEALLRFSATPADYTVPVQYGQRSGNAPYGWYFKGGRLVAQFTLSTGLIDLVTPNALAANTTYDLAATFDGSTGRLYVNGALVASASRTGTLANYVSGYGLTIGDSGSYADPAFKGTIDEVAVYAGKALSATQVSKHYAAATASSSASLATPSPSPTATASPAPTASPALVSSTANVATYQGCPVFTAGDYYNAAITNAATDPNSANYINSVIQAGDTSGFYASTGVEKVNLANNSTPLLTVKQQVSYHTFPVPYPWASGYYIEPLGDKHAMVVQTQSCHLYEAYGTTYSSGVLSAYSGANWDMTKAFVPLAPGNPSAMASGLSLFAGMVKWEDYQSGAIRHALNWAAPAHTVAQYKFVLPASDTDQLPFYGSSGYQLPYGAHLRLKASFSTAGWGPEATMVANAMKTYGIYLADTGSSGNALYFANAPDGSNPWNGSDLSSLSKITMSDFDVVTLPPVQTVPGH